MRKSSFDKVVVPLPSQLYHDLKNTFTNSTSHSLDSAFRSIDIRKGTEDINRFHCWLPFCFTNFIVNQMVPFYNSHLKYLSQVVTLLSLATLTNRLNKNIKRSWELINRLSFSISWMDELTNKSS